MRQRLIDILKSQRWENFIIAVILINSVTLGMATDKDLMASFGPLIDGIDRLILAIFVVEIVARFIAFRFQLFRDPWSVFDVFIVVMALIPATGPFQVLRALRILRLLRLISIIPSLRRVVGGLISALPGMGSIVVLLALLFYVSAVMATKLYGDQFPDWFGSLGASLYTLFQVMTLESWSMGIVRPVMEAYPSAWMFFVPFILLSTYSVLNLFIGVIVSAMQKEAEAHTDAELQSLHSDNTAVLAELRALRAEIGELRQKLTP
ncbi:ion transporter [Ciceribacter sp. L1K22]|uniref:ion transporter n=1 Tax=Ciceribacter sp. L1K22 TaxID=2820275 RepID=UPI0032B13D81